MNNTYNQIVRFVEPNFDNSIIGITFDGRFIYDYNLMIEDYVEQYGCDTDEAIEWIECNTLRTTPYIDKSPIIVNSIDWL